MEGATRLLKQQGAGYGEVLAEHQRILRAAFAAHDGREIDTQGDSFFVAFRTAKEFTDGFFDPFDFLNPLFDGNLPVNGNNANTERRRRPLRRSHVQQAAGGGGEAQRRRALPHLCTARRRPGEERRASPGVRQRDQRGLLLGSDGCQVYGVYGIDLGALCIRGRARP